MIEQINPPAIIQAAFDEARALAECRELIARRDEAKGEHKGATLLLGQMLIAARKAMPGVLRPNGQEAYSDRFKAFVEKAGITLGTAQVYMTYARKPARLEKVKAYSVAYESTYKRAAARRAKILKEVAQLLAEAPDLATARRVIQEELNESV